MSKHDLQARPYHRSRDSIEAHLTIVFAALAVSHYIEHQTGWSIKNSCVPPAATAPSRSKPAARPSLPPTHYPTTSTTRWARSAAPVRTSLAQLGDPELARLTIADGGCTVLPVMTFAAITASRAMPR